MSLFDPIALEKESQMAKKAARKNALNVSQEIRDALTALGKNATHTDVAEYLVKKFPDNAKLKKTTEGKIWYQTVYVQRKRLGVKGKKAAKKMVRKANKGDAFNNGIVSSEVAILALKMGGIDVVRAELDKLAERIGG